MRKIILFCISGFILLFSQSKEVDLSPYVAVLGISQDGGYPQAGCKKVCCDPAWTDPEKRRYVACLAIVDPQTSQRWIIDVTPDFKDQLHLLDQIFPVDDKYGLSGIFLTHAHMGHYAGLIHFGREAMGTKKIPVFAMPKMNDFLKNNGPWDQLVSLENISLHQLTNKGTIRLNDRISITPYLVYHRDEYSETAGFLIEGPQRKVFYLPDIDKWNRGDIIIEDMISLVDVAYLDATFFDEKELPGRNMEDIPHPFIVESMEQFADLENSQKKKIHFIHLNHTNPALIHGSAAAEMIWKNGFKIAEQGEVEPL